MARLVARSLGDPTTAAILADRLQDAGYESEAASVRESAQSNGRLIEMMKSLDPWGSTNEQWPILYCADDFADVELVPTGKA